MAEGLKKAKGKRGERAKISKGSSVVCWRNNLFFSLSLLLPLPLATSSSLSPFADPQHLHLENERLSLVVGQLPPRGERRRLRSQSLDAFFDFGSVARGRRHKRAALGARERAGESRVEARDEVPSALIIGWLSFLRGRGRKEKVR